MDNDNKIKKTANDEQIKEEVQLFLKDNANFSYSKKPAVYNLEEEYAKTKKNKSYRNLISMLICVALVALVSVGLTFYIDYQYKRNIVVSHDVFEDLNLKQLLDMVGRVQDQLDVAVNNKKSLESDMENELKQQDLKLEAEKNLIANQRISSSSKAEKNRQAERNTNARKKEISAQYSVKIEEAKQEIAELEEKLHNFDSSNLTRAQEQEVAIDSQRQVFALEKKNLEQKYEQTISDLRDRLEQQQKQAVIDQKRAVEVAIAEYKNRIQVLDPVVKDETAIKIKNENSAQNNPLQYENEENLEAAQNKMQEMSFDEIVLESKKSANNIKYLSDYVNAIPYENDLSQYVGTMNDIAQKMQQELIQGAEKQIASREEQVDMLNSFIKIYDEKYYANPKSAGAKAISAWDGVVVFAGDNYFLCYVTPEKRLGAEGKKAIFNAGTDKEAIFSFKKAGDFLVAFPYNVPKINAVISVDSYFTFE